MNETTEYLVQFRASEHEKWTDDTMRFVGLPGAVARRAKCHESKILRGAQFRIIRRVDTQVTPI